MDRDLRLMAYLDGELEERERAAFERDLSGDPALQAELDRQQRLRRRLAATYDPVLGEPVPPALAAAASAANDRAAAAWRPAQWAAMAACLAVGVLVGQFALRPQAPFGEREGELVAQGAIARALTDQLASDAGPTKVGLTFRAADGRYCRTFESAPARLAGLACRSGERWVARTLAAWSPPAQAGYRTAGSQTPAPVLAAVDETIAGRPLDAAAEAQARAAGWKP